jgi:HAD superfamily hydrolase (TIGR01509 family)
MSISNIKAIILDMDGVIVDSEPIHEKAEMQTCREFGMEVPKSEMDNFRGKKLEDIFSYASKKYGTGNEPIEKMIERKIGLYLEIALKELQMIDGASDFLKKLETDGRYDFALTTSGRKIQQDQILAKFGFANFFPIMITADDVKHGKPNPEPYAITAKKLNEKPQHCLVIEDSDNGIRSAKAAGCMACGFASQFFTHERLKSVGADAVMDNFEELSKILFV